MAERRNEHGASTQPQPAASPMAGFIMDAQAAPLIFCPRYMRLGSESHLEKVSGAPSIQPHSPPPTLPA